jgi:hypothetical protein
MIPWRQRGSCINPLARYLQHATVEMYLQHATVEILSNFFMAEIGEPLRAICEQEFL